MSPEEPFEKLEEGEEAMELASWRSEWQELGGRDGLAKELAERVRKDGRRLRRSAAIEVSAAAATTTFCVWLLLTSHGAPFAVALSAGILIFNGVWLTRLFTLREGTMGKSASEGVDAFVELTRRRLADDLRWNRFTLRATLALSAAYAPWCVWLFVRGYAFYAAEPWRAVVGFGGIYAISTAIYITQRRKGAKLEGDRRRFEALVAERTLV